MLTSTTPVEGSSTAYNPACNHKLLRIRNLFVLSCLPKNNENIRRAQDAPTDQRILNEHKHRAPRLAKKQGNESFDTHVHTNSVTDASTTAAPLADISKETVRTAPQQVPPIVVTSARCIATTFTVRAELEFTVYCTDVHPIRRWPAVWKIRHPRIHHDVLRSHQTRASSKGKGKAKSVEIELDMLNDTDQPASSTAKDQRFAALNSCWSGLFSGGTHESGKKWP
ncbi:hypothetical protein EW145_g1867 [Phellinidium pouzarii]|uniref:Uncharacterized protein n=1 Tax=Phellinidium pouzarii TaxID=167371 RepID=A0A4S4LCW5_9AGAM|nr:hypothetical protein EW145_g1867 [Phellinidium pouzarii]